MSSIRFIIYLVTISFAFILRFRSLIVNKWESCDIDVFWGIVNPEELAIILDNCIKVGWFLLRSIAEVGFFAGILYLIFM